MGMGGRPGRPRPARDAHQPLLVRRNYLLCPRDIAFPDEVMRSRVWPTLGLGYYVSQPFDPMAVSSHNPQTHAHIRKERYLPFMVILSIYGTSPLWIRKIRVLEFLLLQSY